MHILAWIHAFHWRYIRPILNTEVRSDKLLDRTAAEYQRFGHELLRGDFLRDWIVGGEEDEDELRAFLEEIRAQYSMMDAGIVSERSETYYGTDGRTVPISPDNWERDGWYYLYRGEMPEANIDI